MVRISLTLAEPGKEIIGFANTLTVSGWVDRVGPVPVVRPAKAEPGAPVRGVREWENETHRLGMTPTPGRSFLS